MLQPIFCTHSRSIRVVTSIDGMTADWVLRIPWDFLERSMLLTDIELILEVEFIKN